MMQNIYSHMPPPAAKKKKAQKSQNIQKQMIQPLAPSKY